MPLNEPLIGDCPSLLGKQPEGFRTAPGNIVNYILLCIIVEMLCSVSEINYNTIQFSENLAAL